MNNIVIAFLARAGSGKSTAAQYLIDHHDAVKVSFAGPLKELAKKLYGFDDEQVYGCMKEEPDPRLECINLSIDQHDAGEFDKVTPRQMLQRLGNQGREIIGPTVWIDAALNTIRKNPGRLIVIDDCRYVNEAEAISALPNGHVIKIVSPDRESSADPSHPSEAQVDEVPERLLSGIVTNYQARGLDSFHHTLSEVVADCLGVFPGRMRD